MGLIEGIIWRIYKILKQEISQFQQMNMPLCKCNLAIDFKILSLTNLIQMPFMPTPNLYMVIYILIYLFILMEDVPALWAIIVLMCPRKARQIPCDLSIVVPNLYVVISLVNPIHSHTSG